MPEAVIYYAGWNIYFSGLRPLVFLTPESVEHGMEDVEDKDGYLKKQIKNIYIFFGVRILYPHFPLEDICANCKEILVRLIIVLMRFPKILFLLTYIA